MKRLTMLLSSLSCFVVAGCPSLDGSCRRASFAPGYTLRGRMVAESGEPLAGASVEVTSVLLDWTVGPYGSVTETDGAFMQAWATAINDGVCVSDQDPSAPAEGSSVTPVTRLQRVELVIERDGVMRSLEVEITDEMLQTFHPYAANQVDIGTITVPGE